MINDPSNSSSGNTWSGTAADDILIWDYGEDVIDGGDGSDTFYISASQYINPVSLDDFNPYEDNIIISPSYSNFNFTGYQILNNQIIFEYDGELNNFTNSHGLLTGRVNLPDGLDTKYYDQGYTYQNNPIFFLIVRHRMLLLHNN